VLIDPQSYRAKKLTADLAAARRLRSSRRGRLPPNGERTVPLALLSIPALALQPVTLPAAAADAVANAVVITAVAESRESRTSPTRASLTPRGETTIAILPRLAPVTSGLTETIRNTRVGHRAGLGWSFDAERLRPQHFEWLPADKATQRRAIAANAELGMDFAGDRLSALANASLEKRPNDIAASNRNFASSRTFGAGIGWNHGGQWRFDLSIQSTSAQAKSPIARLADLANGSARSERQVNAQLTLAPVALARRASATFGIRASAGQLTGYDRALAEGGTRRDIGVSLVARLIS
jgi:hypothetical protein